MKRRSTQRSTALKICSETSKVFPPKKQQPKAQCLPKNPHENKQTTFFTEKMTPRHESRGRFTFLPSPFAHCLSDDVCYSAHLTHAGVPNSSASCNMENHGGSSSTISNVTSLPTTRDSSSASVIHDVRCKIRSLPSFSSIRTVSLTSRHPSSSSPVSLKSVSNALRLIPRVRRATRCS